MNKLQLDALARHAQRCHAAWEHRFKSVAALDSWTAHVRDVADMADITIADPEQAAQIVGVTLVIDAVSVQMMREPAFRWHPQHRDSASLPAQLTSALLYPYIEGGR